MIIKSNTKKVLRNRKAKDWATVGHHDSNATPRQLSKRLYQHIMEFAPKKENSNPNYKGVHCQSFSTNQENRKKPKCKCIKNLHNMVHSNFRIISAGNVNDSVAKQIHKARWI